MPVTAIYHFEGEHARRIDEYLHDFNRRTGTEMKRVNPDTPEGAELCRVYDIVEYPTIIATSEDGHLRNMWRGLALPTIDEVSYYVS